MAGRPKKRFYTFIYDSNRQYYTAEVNELGEYAVSSSGKPVPLEYNPANLKGLKIEFGTNKQYFSLNRSMTYPLTFVRDGAAVMRHLDYNIKGFNTEAYIMILKYNNSTGIYELYYTGRLDFNKKKDNPKTGYTVNCLDTSIWGILSQNDDVKYKIDCTGNNPDAIQVLFDGITLKSTFVYQPVASMIDLKSLPGYIIFPIVSVSQDGDSSGIVSQDQQLEYTSDLLKNYVVNRPFNNCYRTAYASTLEIKGTFSYDTIQVPSGYSYSLTWLFWRSTDTVDYPAQLPANRILRIFNSGGNTTTLSDSFEIDQTFNLKDGEYIYFVCVLNLGDVGAASDIHITPKITNISFSTQTKVQPTVAWCLRPLDLLRQIVAKATGGLFTINSNYYTEDNRTVLTCGDALRQSPVAYIYTSFSDWFKSFNSLDFIALRVIDDTLWVEKAISVYRQDTGTILDIGEIQDLEIEQDVERIFSTVEVGSPVQDYRHSSGRLEFNTTNRFSVPVYNVKNTLNLVSVYRKDGFGAEFIRLDYQGGNTKDNSGDTSVFMIRITDERASTTTLVENFVNVTVDNAPLAPIITSPINNDTIGYQSPRIRGRAPAGSLVHIYVDSVLDGSVITDANGNWSYDIVAVLTAYVTNNGTIVTDGVHVIETTFTDLTGEVSTITLNIVTQSPATRITYPANSEAIYNNKPLFKGVGTQGQVLSVSIDGTVVGNVTVDKSCKWEYQSPILYNGNHTIIVGTSSSAFNVNAFTAVPLITSFYDGFTIVNNLPLVEGVGQPGTAVTLYLDYYQNIPVGKTVIDSNGNWSIQLTNLLRTDGTTLTPIPNGLHTLSTDMDILSSPLQTQGYKLSRPAYTSITGVTDNTVINTELSPKRNLLNWGPYISSIFYQNRDLQLIYEGGDKNQALSTTLGGQTITENANVLISSLRLNLFLPIVCSFKTVVPSTFNSIFNSFNNGGVVRATLRGNEIFFLPVGSMSVEDVTNDVQNWKLLMSAKTSLSTLLNLYKNGTTFSIMKNQLFHSDYNSLHMVRYNYAISNKYQNPDMYDDWFENRNSNMLLNPIYIQKFQRTETIRDQIVVNGISNVKLKMYRCSDASLVHEFDYTPLNPAPIPTPDIVFEVSINLGAYPEDQYFFVIEGDGNPLMISERIETKDVWEGSLLFECKNSSNLLDFFYTSGIYSIIRCEGYIPKWSPDVDIITNKDEIGDNLLLHGVATRKRKILIGTAKGTPDYIYMKLSQMITTLDYVLIDGLKYVVDKENSFQEVERYPGHPMYAYEVLVELESNQAGVTIDAGGTSDINSVILVVDAGAFGVGGSGVTEIEITEG